MGLQYFIVADIAGQFDALMRLVARAPAGSRILGVGDLVDRGPQSMQVVDWFMKNGDTCLGNHEHMMIDWVRKTKIYDSDTWKFNGGHTTIRCYKENNRDMTEHSDWLASRPQYFLLGDSKIGSCLVTHAPLHPMFGIMDAVRLNVGSMCPELNASLLWNREEPTRRTYLQIFGHNSHWGFTKFGNPPWAICLDRSREKILTAIHWPSLELFEEPYDVKREAEVSP